MRKLKLAIENLTVESFETSETREGRGTVLGASGICPVPESDPAWGCMDSEFTGPCCDHTLMLSCVQTNCFAECNSFDANVCPG
jgi:hypothetical protein